MNDKANWESEHIISVILPDETYGECNKPTCYNVGELGNGLCQRCWDKGKNIGYKNTVPNISISYTEKRG